MTLPSTREARTASSVQRPAMSAVVVGIATHKTTLLMGGRAPGGPTPYEGGKK